MGFGRVGEIGGVLGVMWKVFVLSMYGMDDDECVQERGEER